jgi:hypothetical protein
MPESSRDVIVLTSTSLKNAWLVALVAVAAACGSGDWSEYDPDPGALPDDTVESASYPAGPYGTKVGDKIADLTFDQAFFDPETLCKGAQDLDLEQSGGLQSLSLLDIYRGDALCPGKKKQFLWLIASAGW